MQSGDERQDCETSNGIVSDIGTAGRLIVSDFSNNRVRAIDMASKVVTTIL